MLLSALKEERADRVKSYPIMPKKNDGLENLDI